MYQNHHLRSPDNILKGTLYDSNNYTRLRESSPRSDLGDPLQTNRCIIHLAYHSTSSRIPLPPSCTKCLSRYIHFRSKYHPLNTYLIDNLASCILLYPVDPRLATTLRFIPHLSAFQHSRLPALDPSRPVLQPHTPKSQFALVPPPYLRYLS